MLEKRFISISLVLTHCCMSAAGQGACVDGDTTMMVTELLDTDLYRALQVHRTAGCWGRWQGLPCARFLQCFIMAASWYPFATIEGAHQPCMFVVCS